MDCTDRLPPRFGRSRMVAVAEILERTGGAVARWEGRVTSLFRNHGQADRNEGGTGIPRGRANSGVTRIGSAGCGDSAGWQRATLAACVRSRSAGAVGDGRDSILEI